MACGKMFYRRKSYILRGIRKSCGAPECKSKSMSGANNPFWGKSHTPEVMAVMKEKCRTRPNNGKSGPAKGYKHTPEARQKITEALRLRWKNNRDKMLANLPRGESHPAKRLHPEPRHRKKFTTLQRREWKDPKCAWCRSTEKLNLDHIVPIMAGGKNERTNAQTLCHPCNVWKMKYVDRPYFLSILGSKAGQT